MKHGEPRVDFKEQVENGVSMYLPVGENGGRSMGSALACIPVKKPRQERRGAGVGGYLSWALGNRMGQDWNMTSQWTYFIQLWTM